ncbi:hypothetical protein [Polaromonas sp. CG9_12]|nr:hypothetical protein [Polaromonas sp. CG9_12]
MSIYFSYFIRALSRAVFAAKNFLFVFINFLRVDDEKNCICYFVVSFIYRVCIRENGKQRGLSQG